MIRTSLIFALSVFVAGTATAQQQGELIPRALAEALIAARSYGEGKATIVVGSLPPTLESKISLPTDARVLGGMMSQSGATAVILLEGPLNAAPERLHAELIKRGWEPEDQGPQRMGGDFIDAPVGQRRAVSGGRPDTYCGRAGTLIVRYDPEGFAQTRASVSTTGENRCAMMREAMMSSAALGPDRRRAPILVNPAGARNQDYGFCLQSYSSSGGPGAQLSSTMSPAEILSHYAKQLADSGWKESGAGVTQTWSRPDTTGSVREYQITITTTAGNPMCRRVEAELRARR